jgi:hypothetical protein
MGKMIRAYKVLVGKPGWKRPLEDLGMDERIILEWILGKYGRKLRTGFNWLRIGTNGPLL